MSATVARAGPAARCEIGGRQSAVALAASRRSAAERPLKGMTERQSAGRGGYGQARPGSGDAACGHSGPG